MVKIKLLEGEYQNQNSLLVKRQTDNTTPGGWGLTGAEGISPLSLTLTRTFTPINFLHAFIWHGSPMQEVKNSQITRLPNS